MEASAFATLWRLPPRMAALDLYLHFSTKCAGVDPRGLCACSRRCDYSSIATCSRTLWGRSSACGAVAHDKSEPKPKLAAHRCASEVMLGRAPACAEAGEGLAAVAEPVLGIGCCSKSNAFAGDVVQLWPVIGCSGGTGQSEPARARARFCELAPSLARSTGRLVDGAPAGGYECKAGRAVAGAELCRHVFLGD